MKKKADRGPPDALQVRTIVQTIAAAVFTLVVIFFLDHNFRVLPNVIHEYMPTHHDGLVVTDITLTKCSTLNIFSSCKLDPAVWDRIDKDLYLRKALFSSAYLHVQRKREEELTSDDKVVIDVTVGRLHPDQGGDRGGRRRAAAAAVIGGADEKWESRPGGLWIKRSNRRGVSDSKHAVTDVDVLFGDDAVEARPGWAITGTPLLLNAGSHIPVALLTIRRGAEQEPYKPVPRVADNGRFKIVQLADLHLSTGVGNCRDALPEDWNGGKCEADPRTLDFVTRVLEEEKPNLVVLSGDQVNGETAPDTQTVSVVWSGESVQYHADGKKKKKGIGFSLTRHRQAIFKYAQLLIKLKIPYVTIFGNHDDEGSMSRAEQMELIESLPYSLSRAGPEDIDGVGNYYIEVLARGSSGHSALTVYLLDSHSYSPNERKYRGYDWIKKSQIDWFRRTAQSLKREHKEYTHVHLDVAFIHIPLPEYTLPNLTLVGDWREPSTAPAYNSGFYDALVEEGIVMVSCGQYVFSSLFSLLPFLRKFPEADVRFRGFSDHVNEYCGLSSTADGKPALWMCHAGAAGFGGYAGYGGFHRKIRVFDFDMNGARITTWKRVEWGPDVDKRIDELIIVDAGKPVAPMQE